MARKRGHGGGGHANHERWLLTYADLITLLLIYFIVLFAMSQIDVSKYHKMADAVSNAFNIIPSQGGAAESVLPPGSKAVIPPVSPMYEEEERTYKEVSKAVKDAAAQLKASASFEVHEESRGLVISIADTAIFTGGSADLKPEMRKALDTIGAKLSTMHNRVHIEGHSDDIPISTPRYPSNWELSTARATNVLRYLSDRGGLPPSRLAASGYGEHYPRVPNTSPENRAKNRRVDIVILRDTKSAQEPQDRGMTGAGATHGAGRADPGANPGADHGSGTGMDLGAGTGIDLGAGTGADHGAGAGTTEGTQEYGH